MKTRRIPFDINKAKSGAKVVTRAGYSVRIGFFDAKSNKYPIIAAVDTGGGECPYSFTEQGRSVYGADENEYNELDLFIEEEEEETDDYNPYKATVESIADMVERYADADSDLKDFYNQVRVRCKEAVEYEKKWIKNQGEQKSFNTVKPKFKVGDWIVNKGHSYLIADIDYLDNRYLFEIGGYTHEKLNWEYIKNADEHYYLWTMRQDAENGDVIACNSSIMLFKEIDDLNNIKGHCTYHFTDTPMFFVDSLSTRDVFHPATKEQRDLLFQKIKEEGYEWDSDKKELHKIEEVKKRRMTNQELAWWIRDCPEEHREVCRVDEDTIYSRYIYRKCDANEEVPEFVRIRKNGGEWQEPLIEI